MKRPVLTSLVSKAATSVAKVAILRTHLRSAIAIALLVAGSLVQADECLDCVEIGKWRVNVGLGLGMRSNPLHLGDDTPLIVLPEISYYGERFFLKNLEMGFTLFENDRHQFNALITPGYDQMYFNRWDPFNFTAGGGFTAGGFVGIGSTPPSLAAGYQVNISGTQDSKNNPIGSESEPSGVQISQANAVYINDQYIALGEGRQMLFGVEGNPITVHIEEGVVDIRGVVTGDRIRLDGVQFTNPKDLESVGGADLEFDGSRNSNSILIDLEKGNLYRVTGESDVQAERQQIEADAVASRRMAGLAGFEYSYLTRYATFHFQALKDFTNVHHGHEVRAAVIFPWYIGEQKWALTLGGNYKSRDILDYYYGVGPRDTDMVDLFFTPTSSGVEKMVRLDWQFPLTEKWSLRAMTQYSRLPSSVHDSPLMSDKEVKSIFFGGIYHF